MTVEMHDVTINGRWSLKVPQHRVDQWSRPWEVERLNSMFANIRLGDAVYDVGAEQFDMSGVIASWGAAMVLIEPSPFGWPTGKAIWEANKLSDPLLSFHGFAASVTTSNLDLSWIGFSKGAWPRVASNPMNAGEGFAVLPQRPDIDRLALDDLIQCAPIPDVITMDVEGAEWEVLRGSERILRTDKPLIFISEHPEFAFKNFGYYMNDMHSWLHALGYQSKFLAWDHEIHMLWHHPDGRRPVEI